MTRNLIRGIARLSAAVLASLTLPVEAATYSTYRLLELFQHPVAVIRNGRLLLGSGSLFGTGQAGGGYQWNKSLS